MLRSCLAVLLSSSFALAAGTSVQFDVADPAAGPFPSDSYTVADSAQKTGIRVNLPQPDCGAQPSACAELALINQMDGFSLTSRLRARFTGAIKTSTLAAGLKIIALDNITADETGMHKTGDVIGVNQVLWDAASNTVYAKPDAVLDQHRHYALAITDAIQDAAGDPLTPAAAYQVCAQGNGGDFCTALAAALPTIAGKVAPAKLVAATVFTTVSATAWLEKARDLLNDTPASVTMLQPQSIFKLADYSKIELNQQTGVDPVKLSNFTIPLADVAQLLQGLSSIAIGSFRSPNFLDAGQTIAPSPTGDGPALPDATNEIFFNALLPSSPKPEAGYPVMIFGHGFGDSRFGGPTAIAPTFTAAGYAVVAINAAGHGSGPQSTITFVDTQRNRTTIPAGGRSVDLNGDGVIEANEGCAVFAPVAVGLRDCFRQTVVDLLQLVRVLRAGVDLDGDGKPDLDAGHIYYAGESLGGLYGTIFNALTPDVRAVALNVGGGTVADIARWSPSYYDLARDALGQRTPSLLNKGKDWDQDYVLRDQPVKTLSVAGAVDVQNFFETVEWLSNAGDPIAFAPHLKTSPLPGVSAKPVLVQFARGDRTVPNPANSALIRAGNLRESSWMYRHDLVKATQSGASLPANPHPYLVLFVSLDGDTITLPAPAGLLLSVAAQTQIAGFFAADGATIPDPNNLLVLLAVGIPAFEVPAKLPEDLGF